MPVMTKTEMYSFLASASVISYWPVPVDILSGFENEVRNVKLAQSPFLLGGHVFIAVLASVEQ